MLAGLVFIEKLDGIRGGYGVAGDSCGAGNVNANRATVKSDDRATTIGRVQNRIVLQNAFKTPTIDTQPTVNFDFRFQVSLQSGQRHQHDLHVDYVITARDL